MKKERKSQLDKSNGVTCFILGGIDGYLAMGPDAINKLTDAINEKKFRVKNSGTSHRVINYLEKEGLIDSKRKTTSSWRSFSLKELIYLGVIKELRLFGFKNKQLKLLKESFFSSKLKNCADTAIHYALNKSAIYLIIDSLGNATFFDGMGLDIFVKKDSTSHMTVNINNIYNDVRNKLGKDSVSYTTMSDTIAEILSDFDLNDKELEIIKVIRMIKYKKITIKKTGADDFIIKAEHTKPKQENELLEILKEGNYHDISIKTKDGKIVNIRKEDAFKV